MEQNTAKLHQLHPADQIKKQKNPIEIDPQQQIALLTETGEKFGHHLNKVVGLTVGRMTVQNLISLIERLRAMAESTGDEEFKNRVDKAVETFAPVVRGMEKVFSSRR